MGVDIPVQFFDYEADGKKFVIWGLTAHILIRAAAVIFQRQPSFPEFHRTITVSSPGAYNDSRPDKS